MEKSKEAGYEQSHRDRPVKEDYEHDGYKARGKLAEPTVCPGCNAVYGYADQCLRIPTACQ
jgi:hypothetical protein